VVYGLGSEALMCLGGKTGMADGNGTLAGIEKWRSGSIFIFGRQVSNLAEQT
jgi:ABC-type sugar transport system ATPase subunit